MFHIAGTGWVAPSWSSELKILSYDAADGTNDALVQLHNFEVSRDSLLLFDLMCGSGW